VVYVEEHRVRGNVVRSLSSPLQFSSRRLEEARSGMLPRAHF
jgi:hypothetical protein